MTAAAFPPLLRARAFLRRLPCKPLLVLTVLCLTLKEQYPFSHFPMYSSFTNRTYYVYLADGADQPLPTVTTVGVSTPTLKKIYDREVRRALRDWQVRRQELTAEQKQQIGGPILERLRSSATAQQVGEAFPEVLRLYQVDIELTGGEFQKRRTLIAEVR